MERHETPYPLSYVLKLSVLFFYKDDFEIKKPRKVDIPLNQQTKKLKP